MVHSKKPDDGHPVKSLKDLTFAYRQSVPAMKPLLDAESVLPPAYWINKLWNKTKRHIQHEQVLEEKMAKRFNKCEQEIAGAGFVKLPSRDGNHIYQIKCRDCHATWDHHAKAGKMLPAQLIYKKARRDGWFVAEGKKPLCQTHAVNKPIFKTIVMREEPIAPVAKLKKETPPPTPPKEDTTMGKEPMNLNIAQPNMKMVRQVMNLLEDHFDSNALRYKPGFSDEKIAADTGLHIIQVAKIRSEAFGEIAEDPAITKLRDDLAENELRAEQNLNDARALSARLETFIASRQFKR